MAPQDEPGSSVRIELSDTDDLVAPEVDDSRTAASTPRIAALASVSIGLFVIIGLVVMLSPDSGETAAGTPITLPTTTVASTTSAPDSTDGPPGRASVEAESTEDPNVATTIASRRELTEMFESDTPDFFPLVVTEADLGWLAIGIPESLGSDPGGSIYRSIDGLRWNQVSASPTLPEGDVIGLQRVGSQYLLALDELSNWRASNTRSTDLEATEHRVTFWTSPNAVDWEPLPDYPTIAGAGFPYPVSFTQQVTAVPIVAPPSEDESLQALAEYLSPILDEATAKQVCQVTDWNANGVRSRRFLDCDGNVLIELAPDEIPAVLVPFEIGSCVAQLRSGGESKSLVHMIDPAGEPTLIDVSNVHPFGVFGTVVEDTYLTVNAPTSPTASCLSRDGRTEEALLFKTSVTNGTTVVELPATNADAESVGLAAQSDGVLYLSTRSDVLVSEAPFEDWSVLPISTSAPKSPSFMQGITMSINGNMLMTSSGGNWWFARPDDTEWVEVEVNTAEYAQAFLATDEYVIVQLFANGVTFVKVPLP